MRADHVSNKPLREEVLRRVGRGEITLEEITLHLGWMRAPTHHHPTPSADTTRLQRRLGLFPYISHGKPTIQKTINPDTAAEIARAAGIYPRDVNL